MDVNPHQFGDQMTLFDAPLGQPARGTFKGNQHARLYRAVAVNPRHMDAVRKSEWGDDVGGSSEAAVHEVLNHINQPRQDARHDINMGIHWQHDLATAQDMAADLARNNRHGDHALTVIIEADHPGYEHIIDNSTDWKGGKPVPPKEVGPDPDGRGVPRNRLTGHAKDWSLINDTVGPHDFDSSMLAEVPVRPGAPMKVHAVHMPDAGSWARTDHIRNPVQFKGIA